MTFKEASVFTVRFGLYNNQMLDNIAGTDRGLCYLDWLVGQPWIRPDLRAALECYLADAPIKRALEKALMEQNPAEGLHHNVPELEYRAWDAMNYSRIKLLDESVELFKYREQHPQQSTDAMNFGTAVHIAVNEPLVFADRVAVGPDCDKKSNVNKERWADFNRENHGKVILKQDEFHRVMDCAQAVREHLVARNMFTDGSAEVAMCWTDRETGVVCKGRIDRLVEGVGIFDIKTTRDVSAGPFQNEIVEYGYAIQAALYRDGYKRLTGKDLPYKIMAVQSVPPHRVKVYRMNHNGMEYGRLKYRRALYAYKLCLKSGIWKDEQVEEEIGPSSWALRSEGIEPERDF